VSLKPVPAGPFAADTLMELAATADGVLFSRFVSAYQPVVFRWALTFASDADEAEDLTQETFIRAFRKIRQYRGEGAIEGWLYRIVRSVGVERKRVAFRRRLLGRSPAARPERDVYTTDPGARVDSQTISALIHRYFADLPAGQREVFDLVDLQHHTPAEVALLTGRSAGAVRVSLFQARSVIRDRLLATYAAKGDIL
jgi:RNA polymerase sigma-70 factor (ECF subfamily)